MKTLTLTVEFFRFMGDLGEKYFESKGEKIKYTLLLPGGCFFELFLISNLDTYIDPSASSFQL